MNDKPSKTKTTLTVTKLDDIESAKIVCETEKSRREPKKAIRDMLDVDWGEGVSLAEASGPTGTDNWLKVLTDRDAERGQKFAELIQQTRAGAPIEPTKPRRMNLIGATELARTKFDPKWLIKDILVAGQPCVIGAHRKGMKTSIAIDIGVSLAAQSPFLGQFAIPKPVTTILLSGESGGSAIQSTMLRVCGSKEIRVDRIEGRFFVGLDLPRLSNSDDMTELSELIQNVQAGVVIIDPLYLCLATGSIDVKNLYDVGPLLLDVAKVCLDAGATPILIHHYNKQSGKDPFAKPELEHLAFAGIQEFARQWILLGRRARYGNDGNHELWLNVGGSIGHSSDWAVDIHEGRMSDDFGGRTWEVNVKSASEIIVEDQSNRQAQARIRDQQNAIIKEDRMRDHDEKILAVLRSLGGEAPRSKAYSLAKLSSTLGKPALDRLEAAGRIEPCHISYPRGSGKTSGPGIRLANPKSFSDIP